MNPPSIVKVTHRLFRRDGVFGSYVLVAIVGVLVGMMAQTVLGVSFAWQSR